MTERRFDPTVAEWRTFTGLQPDPGGTDDGPCRYCPTLDPQRPTDIPADSYQLAVVDDPLPALSSEPPGPTVASDRIYQARPAVGASEVVLYSDRHGRRLADLDEEHVVRLLDVWADRYAVLGSREDIRYVFAFEDGTARGTSAGHPYGRVHGYPEIPPLMQRELRAAVGHQDDRGTCLFCDIVAYERADGRRVVAENESFLAFVPFAARFPYELHIYAERHATSVLDCTDPERRALAELLLAAVRGYRNLLGPDTPYVMAVHQAPTDDGEWLAVSHLHVEFAPYRRPSAAELGAGVFIGDCLPESAAAQLRDALSRPAGGDATR